jgi:hypothetical protein
MLEVLKQSSSLYRQFDIAASARNFASRFTDMLPLRGRPFSGVNSAFVIAAAKGDEEARQVLRAYCLSHYYHKDQERKSGAPFTEHTDAVGNSQGMDPHAVSAGYLHDVIEDTKDHTVPVTEDTLRLFGFHEDVITDVKLVTRMDELYYDKAEKIRFSRRPSAMELKEGDIDHNNWSDYKRWPKLTPSEKRMNLVRHVVADYLQEGLDHPEIPDCTVPDFVFRKYKDEPNFHKIVDTLKDHSSHHRDEPGQPHLAA